MAESKDDLRPPVPQRHMRLRTSPTRFITFNLLVGGACIAILYSLSHFFHIYGGYPEVSDPLQQDAELVWGVVPPSAVENLVWIPCYENLQCAKLTVPLDYAAPDGPSAIIAMVKVPAKVPKSDKRYRGPVLFNPGGPGGSGVDIIKERGKLFQVVLGDEYDLIGFDPRAVGRTIPNVNIFPDEAEGTRWRLQLEALPLPNVTQDAVSRIYAQSLVYGKLAEARTMDASPYVSTALVCRDMLSIIRAHGREKIQYWGFSYGTVLGATFAAMFPDHIERLIIDGVEEAEDYYGTHWSENLVDTDNVLDWFFKECVEAGSELCAFYDASVSKVQERFKALLESLKSNPLAVTAAETLSTPADYGVVDYALTLRIIFSFLYSPYPGQGFARPTTPSMLATALAAAEKGDGVPLWNLQKNNTEQFKCYCGGPNPPAPLPFNIDATSAISCSDGDVVEDSAEELQALWDKMLQESIFASLWGGRARCAGWKIRSVERFRGPFVGNTSYPILIIGNTADPVTPLVNAHTMAKGYTGSVVLTQNSAGHCSLSASSSCTAKAVRDYFRQGKLPEPGTVCEVESRMFPRSDADLDDEALLMNMSEEDARAVMAWRELSNMFEPPRYGVYVM